MGWGEPHGPTTGDLERIDEALTRAGILGPASLASRVLVALDRMQAAVDTASTQALELERLLAERPLLPGWEPWADYDENGERRDTADADLDEPWEDDVSDD